MFNKKTPEIKFLTNTDDRLIFSTERIGVSSGLEAFLNRIQDILLADDGELNSNYMLGWMDSILIYYVLDLDTGVVSTSFEIVNPPGGGVNADLDLILRRLGDEDLWSFRNKEAKLLESEISGLVNTNVEKIKNISREKDLGRLLDLAYKQFPNIKRRPTSLFTQEEVDILNQLTQMLHSGSSANYSLARLEFEIQEKNTRSISAYYKVNGKNNPINNFERFKEEAEPLCIELYKLMTKRQKGPWVKMELELEKNNGSKTIFTYP